MKELLKEIKSLEKQTKKCIGKLRKELVGRRCVWAREKYEIVDVHHGANGVLVKLGTEFIWTNIETIRMIEGEER